MIRSILFLCILATALGEILPGRPNYPDFGYRRQIGDTRDEKVPPHYQHVIQNTRRHHKPVLRNRLILSLSQDSSIRDEDVSRANERTEVKHAVKPALRGDSYNHWVRKDENKLTKRDNPNDDLNRDAVSVDYRENAESVNSHEETDENKNLPQPELKTEPSLDPNSLSDQIYFEPEGQVQFNEPQDQNQGYDDPQIQGQDPNSPQSEQGFNAPQDPPGNDNSSISQIYDSPQDQIQSSNAPTQIQEYNVPIVNTRGQNGLQRNLKGSTPLISGQIPKYSSYQEIGQEYNIPQPLDLKRDFNLYEGKERGYTPQTLVQNQDYAYQGVGKGYNTPLGQNQDYNGLGVRQDYNPPEGPGNPPLGLGSAPQGPSYPPSDIGVPSTGQNYNPPEGSGLGNTPGILGNAPVSFVNAQGGFGNAQGGFGNAQGGFGNAQGGFGNAQGSLGNAQGGLGNVPGGLGNTPDSLGNALGGFGNAQGGFVNSQGGFVNSQVGFGNALGGFGNAQDVLGNSPGGLGNAPGGFGNAQNGLVNAPGSIGSTQGGIGNAQSGFGNTPGGFGNAPGDFENSPGGIGNAQGGFGNAPGSFGNAPGSIGNAPGIPIVPEQQYAINPTPCPIQIGPQGQIYNQCQNQYQDCSIIGQCNSNDSYQVRNKLLQLIRDTKLAIDQKVMPINEIHLAYKTNRLYRIGYLISSINKTQDSVADFYRYVKQNINSWDYLKVLQAYEQVKSADAFVSNVLYTLNQLVATVSVFDVMRSGRPSVQTLQTSEKFYPKEYDKELDEDELNWWYYDD